MGESIVSRRGGGGGKLNIFLQTTQPPADKGGLWVKTGLQKYVFDAGTVPGGSVYSVGAASAAIETPCIYGGIIYFIPRVSSSTRSFYAFSISTGITSQKADFSVSAYGSAVLYAYDGVVYLSYGHTSSSAFRKNIEKYSIASNTWTAVTVGQMGDANWGCVGNGSSIVLVNRGYYNYEVWDLTANTFTELTNSQGRACGFDGTNGYGFGAQVDSSTRNAAYKTNIRTNISSQLATMPINPGKGSYSGSFVTPIGLFGGIVYFNTCENQSTGRPRWIYGYSIASDTYSLVHTWETDLTFCSNLLYQGTAYLCKQNATDISALAITGSHTASDNVVIAPGIAGNVARIAAAKQGSADIPIAGVYTVQNSRLKPAEAYVSTGGTWTAVRY